MDESSFDRLINLPINDKFFIISIGWLKRLQKANNTGGFVVVDHDIQLMSDDHHKKENDKSAILIFKSYTYIL